MSKFEKLVYAGCPFFFGMILVVVALLNASEMETTNALLVICSGLICMSPFLRMLTLRKDC